MEPLYLGREHVPGFEHNRITFARSFRDIFLERQGSEGKLYCRKEDEKQTGTPYLALTDNATLAEDLKEITFGSHGRLLFPKGMRLSGERLVFLGAGEWIDVFNEEEWNRVMRDAQTETRIRELLYQRP